MAVTVKIQDKSKKQKPKAEKNLPPPAALADYALKELRGEGIKMLLLWMLFMFIGSAFVFEPLTEGIGIGIFLWWIAATIGYFLIGPRIVQNRLRQHGSEFRITAAKHGRIANLLAKASPMIGVGEPEAYLVEGEVPQVRISGSSKPYFMVISKATLETLQPPEIDCLILRCLIHARIGTVRRLTIMQFLGDTPPAARALAWPIQLFSWLLRMNWQEYAEESADRLTLLLIKNPSLMMGALLKMFAATDPKLMEYEVTNEDVDSYVKQSGYIGMEGNEISTQFKLGSAIQENPYLEARLKGLTSWAKSAEYKAALEKLAEARTTAPAVPLDPLAGAPGK